MQLVLGRPAPPRTDAKMSGMVILQAMLITAILFTFISLVGTINYRITAEALEIYTLGLVARRIPLLEIEEVHRRGALLHENWSGPRFWNAVTIRRSRGFLKSLVISPDHPDQFALRLAESVRRRKTTSPPT